MSRARRLTPHGGSWRGGGGGGEGVFGHDIGDKSRQSLEKQEVDDDDDDPSPMITMVGAEQGEGPHPRKGTHCGRNADHDDDFPPSHR